MANSRCDSYRVTLNHNEKIVDQAEQDRRLKDCHQRCADRTLRVLEKNGSIFIKLGQHLVWDLFIFRCMMHRLIGSRRVP